MVEGRVSDIIIRSGFGNGGVGSDGREGYKKGLALLLE
jgi:hypothetical protein